MLKRGESITDSLSDGLLASGWQGCQGVVWTAPAVGVDEFKVGVSDGWVAGLLLDGSNESGDQYTGLTGNQVAYGYAVLCYGNWLLMTRTIERYTWASRQGGPLVDIVYVESAPLFLSLEGKLTTEDEFTLSGDPRAPNTSYIGYVCQVPSVDNDYYLTFQMSA